MSNQTNEITPPNDPGDVVVIGAGPAGLTAAYQLGKAGHTATVLEADDVVGGISRTVVADGYRFDIGGHRFFTKVQAVEDLWHEILPDEDFMLRPRSSRIYYQGKFFDYPLKPVKALRTLGIVEAIRCAVSFLWVRIRPPKDQTTLEGYVAANYGWRLYQHFFKTYSTKVWAVPPSEISADWGAQRIKGMTLWGAVLGADQGPVRDPARQVEAGHQPDRGVPVPQARPRDDVGAVHGAGPGPGLQGGLRRPGHHHRPATAAAPCRSPPPTARARSRPTRPTT